MATKKKEYEVKGMTTMIRATSRASIKIRDNFYTLESTEERYIPEGEDIDLDKEWDALYESVNAVTDFQIQEIVKEFKK